MSRILLLILLVSCSHNTIRQIPETPVSRYQRTEWNHWTDKDKNCINSRNEILLQRSLGAVKFNKKGCKVVSGLWQDYYYPETHTESKKVDIDHVVPLKHAHYAGGFAWTPELKEKFANDPDNLVITNRTYNRKKGAKGIHEWLPVNKDYACKYIHDWMKIKKKYNLQVSNAEKMTKC